MGGNAPALEGRPLTLVVRQFLSHLLLPHNMAAAVALFKAHYVDALIDFSDVPPLDESMVVRFVLLTLPIYYYFVLWHFPGPWCRFAASCGAEPSYLMGKVGYVLKLVQFVVLFGPGQASFPVWLADTVGAVVPLASWNSATHAVDFTNVTTYVDVFMLVFGQALNSGVYAALGTVGVYYGVRFGRTVPWHHGFPYNLGISDPQYWGAVLTILGLKGLFQLQVVNVWIMVLSYFFMMWVESRERTDRYLGGKNRRQ